MQELGKILEEIDNLKSECLNGEYEPAYGAGALDMANAIKDIIRSLSRENDSEITRSSRDNDGWIPVEERLPEDDIPTPKLVTALVPDRKARWDNSETFSVIVDTDVYDPDYTGKWECYKKNVIAWRPLPEPYRPEKESEGSRRLREREEFFKG